MDAEAQIAVDARHIHDDEGSRATKRTHTHIFDPRITHNNKSGFKPVSFSIIF
jgi:hypothetical protein